jgi:hypothetical protein
MKATIGNVTATSLKAVFLSISPASPTNPFFLQTNQGRFGHYHSTLAIVASQWSWEIER